MVVAFRPIDATLDIEQPDELLTYLRADGWIGEQSRPRTRVLGGGVSNRTVLVEWENGTWVLKQALAKLRVPVDWFSDPARVHQEARALQWLEELAPEGSVPGFVFEDRLHHVLCMEAVPEPHENWKEKLLAGRVEGRDIEAFGTLLGVIHRRSADRLDELRPELRYRGFFETLRLEPYYLYTAGEVPAAAHFLSALVHKTRTVSVALVHGDFSPKNVLLREGRLVLLDHEVAHVGDPAFDLGFSIAHLLSKAHHLPKVRGELLASVTLYWDTYRQTIGEAGFADGIEERAVRHTLACLLARARGRSQLEYLSDDEKDRQAKAVLQILPGPRTIRGLVETFAEEIG